MKTALDISQLGCSKAGSPRWFSTVGIAFLIWAAGCHERGRAFERPDDEKKIDIYSEKCEVLLSFKYELQTVLKSICIVPPIQEERKLIMEKCDNDDDDGDNDDDAKDDHDNDDGGDVDDE